MEQLGQNEVDEHHKQVHIISMESFYKPLSEEQRKLQLKENETLITQVNRFPFEIELNPYFSIRMQVKQENPPAWTQEAYRPQRIKYSICYP